jgi:phosphopantetheinyl transferase
MNLQLAECTANASLDSLRPELAVTEFEFLGGMRDLLRARLRAHAYILIRRLLGRHADEAPVTYDHDGRPRISGLAIDASISHKGERVAVAVVGDSLRVGVDLESLGEPINIPAFARFALASGEQTQVDRMRARGWSGREALISIWSAKESFCKCAGYPLRPTDFALAWTSRCDAADIHVEPALERFLTQRGLSSPRISMTAGGGWVRTVALMDRRPRIGIL